MENSEPQTHKADEKIDAIKDAVKEISLVLAQNFSHTYANRINQAVWKMEQLWKNQ